MSLTAYHTDEHVRLYHGDCIEVMRQLPDASVDAVVTDPPYGLGFMGREWDDLPPGIDFAVECLRVLKPGGHLLAFGGTRTWHRLACAIEDAGFEVRDSIAWMYGSGFPKSLDVSKAIDKAAGAERPLGRVIPYDAPKGHSFAGETYSDDGSERVVIHETAPAAPATPDAARWQGWGTALKPAFEPIVVARKPLIGTVSANVLAHGTGALNVDGCRIGTTVETWPASRSYGGDPSEVAFTKTSGGVSRAQATGEAPAGRWPANVILDESQAEALDRMSGVLHSQDPATRASKSKAQGVTEMGTGASVEYGDTGGASRFFYTAKADSSERPRVDGVAHPTVKPLDLMRYLVRLVTPPGGVVLEPFAGSGTTLEACIVEGFRCIGIEREADYLPLIMQRISKPIQVTLL